MTYFRDNIDRMAAYVPGEQPADTGRLIKLNTNENPYPPSPLAMTAMAETAADHLRIYPDARAGRFVHAVSEWIGYPPDWILAANGSDNLLMMIARSAGGPGRRIAYLSPTFPFYETQADIEDSERVEVECDEDFAFPLAGLIEAQAHVTFLANPNSPTGVAATQEQLEELAQALLGRGILVIDEAYADFADANAIDLPRKYENVILLRTLSKSYSLAGLRLGYAVANPLLLAGLYKAKEIYNVSALADRIGAAAIGDADHMRGNVAKIRASRGELADALRQRNWRVIDSQTNFLLAGPADGRGEWMSNELKVRSVLVRYFKQYERLAGLMRITIGSPEQNQALLRAIDEIGTS